MINSYIGNLLEFLFALICLFFFHLFKIFISLLILLVFKHLPNFNFLLKFQLPHSNLLMLPHTLCFVQSHLPAETHLFVCFLRLLVIRIVLRQVVDVEVISNAFCLDRVLKVVASVKQMLGDTGVGCSQYKRTWLVLLV